MSVPGEHGVRAGVYVHRGPGGQALRHRAQTSLLWIATFRSPRGLPRTHDTALRIQHAQTRITCAAL